MHCGCMDWFIEGVGLWKKWAGWMVLDDLIVCSIVNIEADSGEKSP